MGLLNTGGDGASSIEYTAKDTIEIKTGNTTRVTVKNKQVEFNDDIQAPGGQAHSLLYMSTGSAGAATEMSSALATGANSLTRTPAVRNGSVLGISLYAQNDVVTAGALTASVTVDGVNQSGLTFTMTTGSAKTTTVAKDTVTFSASQQLGVSLTASSTFAGETTGDGFYVANLLIES